MFFIALVLGVATTVVVFEPPDNNRSMEIRIATIIVMIVFWKFTIEFVLNRRHAKKMRDETERPRSTPE